MRIVIQVGLAMLLAMGMLFTGCNDDTIYRGNEELTDFIWNKNNRIAFEFEITDTASVYDIIVDLRHTNYYTFSNIWLMVYTTYPESEPISQRLELSLSDKEGKWYGDCAGDICDVEQWIQQNAYFNKPGKYSIAFEQLMRTDDLISIMSIGLRVVKVGPKPATPKPTP